MENVCALLSSQSVISKAMEGLGSYIAVDSDLPASSDKSCGCLRSLFALVFPEYLAAEGLHS